ncbi:MAG: response regulator [Parcubacteria group bacterium]|nr:response regulator [Parcubacteria group bacterium]
MTILVVDDEEPVRNLVAEIFRRDGYRVLFADSVLDAFRRWRGCRGSVDLVVTDFHLGNLTAVALINAIRADVRTCPFIVLSGAMSAEERAAVNSEVAEILCKPVRPAELLDAARRVLVRITSGA